jgi:hypothetical protein
MSPLALLPSSWGDASMLARTVTRPSGAQGLLLCDTAAYRSRCSRSAARQFPDFGGKNHKRIRAHLVTIEYRDVNVRYAPGDFPPARDTAARAQSLRRRELREFDQPVIERAKRYVANVPPAIEGQHGDVHTFRVWIPRPHATAEARCDACVDRAGAIPATETGRNRQHSECP